MKKIKFDLNTGKVVIKAKKEIFNMVLYIHNLGRMGKDINEITLLKQDNNFKNE